MSDNGKFDKKTDVEINKLGGGIKVQADGKIVTGSALGTTFLMVAVGKDLYLNKDTSGSNLVIVNRGGDIHVAPGVEIKGTGTAFALGTRDLRGDNFAGADVQVDLIERNYSREPFADSLHLEKWTVVHQLRPRSWLIFFVNSSTSALLTAIVGTKICLLAGMPDLSPLSTLAINAIDW